MDNKAYLDSIAVKEQRRGGSPLDILTPAVIKAIAVGIVFIIAMLIVGVMLNSGNAELKHSYEKLIYTYSKLADYESPLQSYAEKLNSSDIRAANIQLQSSLTNTNMQLQNAASGLKVDPAAINSKVSTEVDNEIGAMEAEFEDGFYAGTLDLNFANATYLEITRILALEAQIRARTNDNALATIIDSSTKDLTVIQEQFKKYIDNH